MRNIHNVIGTEFGWEKVTILRQWEHLEKKIADNKNHRWFTLRCMGQKITPISLDVLDVMTFILFCVSILFNIFISYLLCHSRC